MVCPFGQLGWSASQRLHPGAANRDATCPNKLTLFFNLDLGHDLNCVLDLNFGLDDLGSRRVSEKTVQGDVRLGFVISKGQLEVEVVGAKGLPVPGGTAAPGECEGRAGRGGVGRAGWGGVGQGGVGRTRIGQGRAGQGRAGQGRAGQGRAGQGRAGRRNISRTTHLTSQIWRFRRTHAHTQ